MSVESFDLILVIALEAFRGAAILAGFWKIIECIEPLFYNRPPVVVVEPRFHAFAWSLVGLCAIFAGLPNFLADRVNWMQPGDINTRITATIAWWLIFSALSISSIIRHRRPVLIGVAYSLTAIAAIGASVAANV